MSELMDTQIMLQRSIERALDNFKKIGRSNLTAAKIRSRISSLKDLWTPYQGKHVELMVTTPAAVQKTADYFIKAQFEKTEEIYNSTLDHMRDCLAAFEPPVSPNQSLEGGHASPLASSPSFSHLPPIRLPPFDGAYSEWETFRDRFTALIINNTDLSDFERMHYLSSSLKDRALQTIGNISITADNFRIAWNALKARFESKRRLITNHISSLLGLSTLGRESASDLQSLCDKINIAVSSLKKLDRTPEDLWNDFLVHLLLQRVDAATRKAWNLHTSHADSPTAFEDLNKFLIARIRALEEYSSTSSQKPTPKSASSSCVSVATASTSLPSACPLCKARHYLNLCPDFIAKNPKQRQEIVKRFKRCFNCMSSNHSMRECKSKYTCRSCNQKHHSMLHVDSETSIASAPIAASTSLSEQSSTPKVEVVSLVASAQSSRDSQILLATAWVRVKVPSGRTVTVRALLDQGSEATFISERLAQSLYAKRLRMPISISAIGGTRVGKVRHASSIIISPRDSDSPSLCTIAYILNSLTAYAPRRVAAPSCLEHVSDLAWADADPSSSDSIHILIGADIYSDIIQEGVRKGKAGQPIAQKTIFGWVISGPIGSFSNSVRTPRASSVERSSADITVLHCTNLLPLSEEIQRFWEVEEISQTHNLLPLDEQCETHFVDTHSRQSDGRYIVRLPFKKDPPLAIGRSRLTAERLINSLSRRFKSNTKLERDYYDFMREYSTLGHMRRASSADQTSNQCVYIPHHPVIREDSITTRLRVVFNASYLTSNGTSLNDHLLIGPKLQTDLSAIILLWRHCKFVYTADIAKMYRQILIDPRDLDYQRILWKGDPSEGPVDYQLLTVTYGMNCAPFLALRVMKCLIDDDGHQFPLAVPILRNQTYIDDVLFGGDDVALVRKSRDQLVALLHRGKFELRKWASNSQLLLADIDPSDRGLAISKQIAIDDKIKVLGIVWNPTRDVFQIKVSIGDSAPQSKRAILSAIAKLYDPLGWLTPVIVYAKIIMQQLWRARIGWDEQVPDPLLHSWSMIYTRLSHLNNLQINRWTGITADVSHAELHGFADASTLAYAAAVYLKVTSATGQISISLLSGKSKIAPISPLTVPRLELSAALLLVRLTNFVRSSLSINPVSVTCWTDSTIVLAWLRSHPSRWKVFVANRVHEIQSSLPDAEWRHIPTQDNPADCASRGLYGDELLAHALWWQGPPWLTKARAEWPEEPPLKPVDPYVEAKIIVSHISKPCTHWDLSTRYSSWPKLIRVTAYMLKFINACRRRQGDNQSIKSMDRALSSIECDLAKTFWIKQIQAELYSDEIRKLINNQNVATKSSIASLLPFLDQDGIVRVGGRLRHAPVPFRVRHPILLSSHPLVHLIVSQAHLRVLHGGTQLTLSALRQDYWIIRARSLVKSVIHNCIVCVRERAAVPMQLMGDLPKVRVSPSPRSFSHCGLDYAGPVKVRASAGRGIASRKAYIALFICLATRAIHLELVSDYSSQAFLNAYVRFCSRRGLPHAMYSDNGTTFVGGERELKIAYRSALRDPQFLNKTACDNIKWHFIPPSAPHFGGIWEAGVRSVKHHLRRVLGNHTLSFEEFTTLLCHIEACLNSRPIAPLSDSFDDYDCLTPGHFLIGSALTVAPEPSLLHLKENRLSRWQVVRHVAERFWKRWSQDYVNTLQQRSKWRQSRPSLKIGQLVLLRNALLPPCKWELGRITRLHDGSDGLTRVVTVKTATSEFKRPIVQLCVLPVESNASDKS